MKIWNVALVATSIAREGLWLKTKKSPARLVLRTFILEMGKKMVNQYEQRFFDGRYPHPYLRWRPVYRGQWHRPQYPVWILAHPGSQIRTRAELRWLLHLPERPPAVLARFRHREFRRPHCGWRAASRVSPARNLFDHCAF